MRVLLILFLVLLVPFCLALWASARRPTTHEVDHAEELRELEAARDLIDRLLDAAVDRRDVDSVLAPLVIDEIRTHQRSLRQRPDDEKDS